MSNWRSHEEEAESALAEGGEGGMGAVPMGGMGAVPVEGMGAVPMPPSRQPAAVRGQVMPAFDTLSVHKAFGTRIGSLPSGKDHPA